MYLTSWHTLAMGSLVYVLLCCFPYFRILLLLLLIMIKFKENLLYGKGSEVHPFGSNNTCAASLTQGLGIVGLSRITTRDSLDTLQLEIAGLGLTGMLILVRMSHLNEQSSVDVCVALPMGSELLNQTRITKRDSLGVDWMANKHSLSLELTGWNPSFWLFYLCFLLSFLLLSFPLSLNLQNIQFLIVFLSFQFIKFSFISPCI